MLATFLSLSIIFHVWSLSVRSATVLNAQSWDVLAGADSSSSPSCITVAVIHSAHLNQLTAHYSIPFQTHAITKLTHSFHRQQMSPSAT